MEPPPPPVEPLYYTPDRVELMAGEMVVGEEGEEEAGAIVIADLMKPFDRPIELRNTTPERLGGRAERPRQYSFLAGFETRVTLQRIISLK